ncbi:MAG TPA: extracellular solute-binding protein [Marmoricola sp.]|nr:extracellular solute-binding protein [Marmoricola sp.]
MLRGRRVVVALAALGALVATAACSADDEPKAVPSTSSTPQGPTLLTFAVYGPPQVVTAYTKIAADFSVHHPDTVVNIQPYDNRAEASEAIQRQIAAGDPPDAFLAGLDDLPRLVEEKAVRRLDELLGERHVDFGDGYQRDALEAFSSENALQCMPVDVSPLVVYYNVNLIHLPTLTTPDQRPITAESGWSLDQFAAAARQASHGHVRGVYVAPDLEQVAPFIWSGGGHVVDDLNAPTTLTLSDGASAAALQKLLEVVRDPDITFTRQQLAKRSALQRFKSGKLGMILGFRDLTPELRAQADLGFDVMPLPKVGSKATIGRVTGVCLSSASKHPEKMADFLAYAVSDDAMAQLTATGYVVPTNLDVINSDAFAQPDDMPVSSSVFSSAQRSIHSLPHVATWPSVAASTAKLLEGLFYEPVIDPLGDRLKAIDAASVPLFTPVPSPSAPVSPTATGSPR